MAKIKFRRDTAADWAQVNPVLAQGEPGFEYDTGLLKIGDGGTAWNSLPYSNTGGSGEEITNTDGFNTYSVSVSTNGVVTMTTARGGIEFGAQPEPGAPAHLHIMRPADQEGSTDLYFGDDYNYVKMPNSSYDQQGVEIGSSLNQGTVSVWRFGTDGALTLPLGGDIKDSNGVSVLASVPVTLPPYKGYKAHYGRMYNNYDDPNGPINKIVIYQDTVAPASSIDASTNNDTFTVTGLTGSNVVAMLVTIGQNIVATPLAELKLFTESVIDNVILNNGDAAIVNNIDDMKSAFYNNFATFSSTLTDLKSNFEFFSVNNQFNLSPQFETGKGATFSGISYDISNDTLSLGSWGQNPGTHQVGDVFVIPGNTIQDANGNFLSTPDNDVTVTVTEASEGYIGTTTLTGTLPRPQEIWPSNSMGDGGSDEYDTGNYVNTNLATEISYNNGDAVYGSSEFGGGDYVVTYQNSIFAVLATSTVVDSIGTVGGSGFDGGGTADTGSLYGGDEPSGVNIGNFVFTNSTLTSTDEDMYIKAGDDLWLDALGDDVHIRANDDVRIKAGYNFQDDEAQSEWRFANEGIINFPDGTEQSTAWTGSVDYSNINNTPTIPADVSDLTDTTNLLGGGSADTGNITFDDNSIQGNPLGTVGTKITVNSNYLGATSQNSNVFALNKSTETDQVQVGWVIRGNGGGPQTITNKIDNGSYWNFYVAMGTQTEFPITIESADYQAGSDPQLILSVVPDGVAATSWAFGANGSITFPDATAQTTAYVAADNVTKVSGTWTVNPGTANYSFTVPINGVYQLWVRANIPNGIVSYVATAAVTNANVPVLGTQYAWNYTAAGDPILFTALPTQFVGSEGAISTANPAVGTTNNTFVFGLANSTAENITVAYGYTKIS